MKIDQEISKKIWCDIIQEDKIYDDFSKDDKMNNKTREEKWKKKKTDNIYYYIIRIRN